MKKNSELLAYCGLYCGDCAGYSGEIADAAQHLKETMERYKFQQTVKHLFPEELKDFQALCEKIDFMTQLKCPKICRQRRADEVKCEIWKCCRNNGFFACHECSTFETCSKLQKMTELHGDSCLKNLRAVSEMGVDAWIHRGKRFWFAEDE